MDGCNIDFFILMETRIASSRGEEILKALDFNKWELVQWIGWKSHLIIIKIV